MLRDLISDVQYHLFHAMCYFAGWSTICTAAYILFVAWQGWSAETELQARLEAIYWAFDGGPEAIIWVAVGVIAATLLLTLAIMIVLSLLRGVLWLLGFRSEE